MCSRYPSCMSPNNCSNHSCSIVKVLTGETENITNATVLGVSVVPALPPPPPQPPVVPPAFQNATNEDGESVIIQLEEIILPTLVTEPTNNTGTEIVNFIVPSIMRVTMEPHPQVRVHSFFLSSA